jgi:ATP/maltotriose-dependent transcriptional regulator MalT
MEEIRWITTPKCAQCKPEPCFERRFSCLGCDKLRQKPKIKARRKPVKQALKGSERKTRDGEIITLRAQGLSYGQIAKRLNMPRSTVQCVVMRRSA